VAIEFLTVSEVEGLHEEQLALHGGLGGIRDRGALESAVATPQATFGAVFLHLGIFEMAAAYAYHIAENQPFVDGNKRTALNAALVFLGLNGWDIEDPDERLYDAMIGLSAGVVSRNDLSKTFEALAIPYGDNDQ
jgi:death-on-curing protein